MASDAASLGGAAGQQPVPSRPRTKVGDPHDEAGDAKPSYKSWKKKYRKMRVAFDQQMTECEDLYRKEVKAKALVKRLAIENDRILDVLLDNNNSSQIPPNRRINLALPPTADAMEHADLEVDEPARPGTPTKTSFGKLLAEVPHSSYADTVKSLPSFAQDIEPLDGDAHPLSFLSADDIDNYIYEIDRRMDAENMLPTLAPAARADKTTSAIGAAPSAGGAIATAANGTVAGDFALKNPISVCNWLRKHAPNTFLQDAEAGAGDDAEGDGRKPRGGAKGERGAKGGNRGKRTLLAAKITDSKSAETWDADDDPEFAANAAPSTARGKRKRDDDGGYRPKSGTRPTKKKRKSDGDATPTASRRTKKEPKDD